MNGCDPFDNINWGSVATSTALGAIEGVGLVRALGSIQRTGKIFRAADELAPAGNRIEPTTLHGTTRVAGAGATRGGVLAEDEIRLVRDYGQVMTQADGAAVRVLQNAQGRFDVAVDGNHGLITTFKNLSEKSLRRLASGYGWE